MDEPNPAGWQEPDLVGWTHLSKEISQQITENLKSEKPLLVHCAGDSGAGRSRLIRAVYEHVAQPHGWPALETEIFGPDHLENMRATIHPASVQISNTVDVLYFPVSIDNYEPSSAALVRALDLLAEYLRKADISASLKTADYAQFAADTMLNFLLSRIKNSTIGFGLQVAVDVAKRAWNGHGNVDQQLEHMTERHSSEHARFIRATAKKFPVLICVQGGVVDDGLVKFIKNTMRTFNPLVKLKIAILVTSPDPEGLLKDLNPTTHTLPLLGLSQAEQVAKSFSENVDLSGAQSPLGEQLYSPRDVVQIAFKGDKAGDLYFVQLERLWSRNLEMAEAAALMLACGWESPKPEKMWPEAIRQLAPLAVQGLHKIGWWCDPWKPGKGWPPPRALQKDAALRLINSRQYLVKRFEELRQVRSMSIDVPDNSEEERNEKLRICQVLGDVELESPAVREAILVSAIPWLPESFWTQLVSEKSLSALFNVELAREGQTLLGQDREHGFSFNGPFISLSAHEQWACMRYAQAETSDLSTRLNTVLTHIVSLSPSNSAEAISLLAACQNVSGVAPWRALGRSLDVMVDGGQATELADIAKHFGSGVFQRIASSGCTAMAALLRHDRIKALGHAQDAANTLVKADAENVMPLTAEMVALVVGLCKVVVSSGTFHPSIEKLIRGLWELRDEMFDDDRSAVRRYLRTSLMWRAGDTGINDDFLEELRQDELSRPANDAFLAVSESGIEPNEGLLELLQKVNAAGGEPSQGFPDFVYEGANGRQDWSEVFRDFVYEAANGRQDWSKVFREAVLGLEKFMEDVESVDVVSSCVYAIGTYLKFDSYGLTKQTWMPEPPTPLANDAQELIQALLKLDVEVIDSASCLVLAMCAVVLNEAPDTNLGRLAEAVKGRLSSDPLDLTRQVGKSIRWLLQSDHKVGMELAAKWWIEIENALDIVGPRAASGSLADSWDSLRGNEGDLLRKSVDEQFNSLAKKNFPRTYGWLLTAAETGATGAIPAWPDSFTPPIHHPKKFLV